jgi:hypothetical protein
MTSGLRSEAILHELIHEVGTVRALTTAALQARTEQSRLALLTLLDAETAEISELLHQVCQPLLAAPRAS